MRKKLLLLIAIIVLGHSSNGQVTGSSKEDFSIINLDYRGLHIVKALVEKGRYENAKEALLAYYKQKASKKAPDFSNGEAPVDLKKTASKSILATADSALRHRFQPHKGYGFFDYGKDINWQLWPVKDNEVRWQLHRVKWWQAMALAYYSTKNEQYAKEWIYQFEDWIKKNPLGLSAENDRFAWRPLEISDRIQSLAPIFNIFVQSPSFKADFLLLFLKSYQQQTNYLTLNYADKGNHRLFEAQRSLFAGTSFPEFKDAPKWRKIGIEVLNDGIKEQVYPDGVQFELSPVYHVASIDIFLKAYRTALSAGLENEFPASYKQTIENMIMAYANFMLPDYQSPMFGDSWLGNKDNKMKQFATWSEVFPGNQAIKYFASDRTAGTPPQWLSKGLATSGFYSFRNGWNESSTMLVIKASPPGEFHAQPDNGTFELWSNGRNFTPDAGVYVYSGDSTIMALRNWYRQTRIHSTLTLDNRNMDITKATLKNWRVGKDLDLLTYSNPSYSGLEHQRSVLFIDHQYFILIDNAIGLDQGSVEVHFALKEDSKPTFDREGKRVFTNYADGNNLLIAYLNDDKAVLIEEQGKVSYEYMKELPRPLFAFEKQKEKASTQTFVSILYPYSSNKAPNIRMKANADNDFANGKIDLDLSIEGKKKHIIAQLW